MNHIKSKELEVTPRVAELFRTDTCMPSFSCYKAQRYVHICGFMYRYYLVESFVKNWHKLYEGRPQFVHLAWNVCLAFYCFEDRLVLTLKRPAEYMSMVLFKGVARGVLGCPWPPLCKPFCKQTTYNIQVTIWWVPYVWISVTPPLKNPGYAHGIIERLHVILSRQFRVFRKLECCEAVDDGLNSNMRFTI